MNQQLQADMMVKFSRCKFRLHGVSYEEADCAGAVTLIYRDYRGIALPQDHYEWSDCFHYMPWPVELEEWDVLMMANANPIGLVDHVGVYIGSGLMVHFGRESDGMYCQRVEKFHSRIVSVARYKQ